MASVESLRARHDAILAMYKQRYEEVLECQRHALQDLLPVLQDELDLQEVDLIRARAFLEDPGQSPLPQRAVSQAAAAAHPAAGDLCPEAGGADSDHHPP